MLEGGITYNLLAPERRVRRHALPSPTATPPAFTPRLQWRHGLAGLANTTVAGLDVFPAGWITSRWINPAPSRPAPSTSRTPLAALRPALTWAGAGRSSASTPKPRQWHRGAKPPTPATLSRPASRGISTPAPGCSPASQVFRFANTDGSSATTRSPTPRYSPAAAMHGPSTAPTLKSAPARPTACCCRRHLPSQLTGIGYNPITYANENFDRTRREGLETETRWRALRKLGLNAGLITQNASSWMAPTAATLVHPRAQPQVPGGRGVRLPPPLAATAPPGPVGKRRFGGDFDNLERCSTATASSICTPTGRCAT